MLLESVDLLAEADELHAFLHTLDDADWQRPTTFQNWTPWDVVAHLHFFDGVALLALEGGDAFEARRVSLSERMDRGERASEMARRELGALAPTVLLERWQATCLDLATRLGRCDPGRRLRWFGPDMGVRMFTTARLMETWAHGQAVYDLLRVTRAPTPRLRHVCEIGVRTFGWTFSNRDLAAPGPAPQVRLRAPSGAIWAWNAASASGRVEGDALDFALVVAQVRNVADTALRVEGEVARRWMELAQCFAGAPVDPPAPGARAGR